GLASALIARPPVVNPNGQREGERRPLTHLALDPDPSAVQLHKLLGQRQPEPRALLLAGVLTERRRHKAPPCIFQPRPIGTMSRDRLVGGSPCPSGSRETVTELGAPPTSRTVNPHSRSGRRSPHSQGRVMDHLFIGLDVAKAQLDVHVRPTGETFVVPHD